MPVRQQACHNVQEKRPTLTSAEAPPLIYDYYGFPPESYKITYPAPGCPKLAQRAAELLRCDQNFSSSDFHPPDGYLSFQVLMLLLYIVNQVPSLLTYNLHIASHA